MSIQIDSITDLIADPPEEEIHLSDDEECAAGVWRTLLKKGSAADDARRRVFAMSASRNKSTYRKVEEAVAVIGTSDTGASIPAILTWIINNYPTLDQNKLKVNVKRAVLKGLQNGRLVRTRNSKKAIGVAGSFTFPAQRIKLKTVRLEGRKYVFPILQPLSSSTTADQVKGKTEEEAMSSPKRVSMTPKRAKMTADQVKGKGEGNMSSPKGTNLTPKRTPKRSKLSESGPADKVKGKGEEGNMSSPKSVNSTPKRAKLIASKLVVDGTVSAEGKASEETLSSPKTLNQTPKRAKLNPFKVVVDGEVSTDQVIGKEDEGTMSSQKSFTPKRVKLNGSKLVLEEDTELNAEQVKEKASTEVLSPKRVNFMEPAAVEDSDSDSDDSV